MSKNFKVFTDIGELLTLAGAASKSSRRVVEADLSPISDAAMICVDGSVAWVGPRKQCTVELQHKFGREAEPEIYSLAGRTVLPGFVECHTHLVFAGSRADEFEWRMQGQTYQQIAARGGGIRSTVEQTRKASVETLKTLAQTRADRFAAQGVTTLEVKSGYGLDLETEIRALTVARALNGPRVVTTYLGAHSRSPEIPDYAAYVEWMCAQVMPRLRQLHLADRVDIYIEPGFFSTSEARVYLARAKQLGFAITAHVEQLSDSGGASAVLEFEPQSLDHLVFASDGLIERLATTKTVGVLLPVSDLYLRMQYPRARAMIDAGVPVALSTDFNPGTSPSQDLSLVGVLARLEMKMSLPEVIAAFTTAAAMALGALDRGSLVAGQLCDFAVFEGSWRELFYAVGSHPVREVYRGGETIWSNKN